MTDTLSSSIMLGLRLTPPVPFSPAVFSGSVYSLNGRFEPSCSSQLKAWAEALIKLDNKSRASRSAIVLAAHVGSCWVDSPNLIPAHLAREKWRAAGVRLEHREIQLPSARPHSQFTVNDQEDESRVPDREPYQDF